jgi:hypothetical protein
LDEALSQLNGWEKLDIVREMGAEAAKRWDQGEAALRWAIEARVAEFDKDCELFKRQQQRPTKPETRAILKLGARLDQIGAARKRATRWISWYLERFAGIQRSPGSIEQTLRDAAR